MDAKESRNSTAYVIELSTWLPSHEKTEVMTFIAKTKNSINRGPDKSEVYEIIRETIR